MFPQKNLARKGLKVEVMTRYQICTTAEMVWNVQNTALLDHQGKN